MSDVTADQRHILESVQRLHDRGEALSAAAVAIDAGAEPSPTREVLNTLHTKGLIDASLRLTDDGRAALG